MNCTIGLKPYRSRVGIWEVDLSAEDTSGASVETETQRRKPQKGEHLGFFRGFGEAGQKPSFGIQESRLMAESVAVPP